MKGLIEKIKTGIPVNTVSIETTGLSSKKDRIVSISIIQGAYIEGALYETARYHALSNPGADVKMSEKSVNIHHLTSDVLRRQMDQRALYNEIKPYLDNAVLISFVPRSMEAVFISELYERFEDKYRPPYIFDIKKYAVKTLDLDKYTMEDVCRSLGTLSGVKLHEGMGSAIALARCVNFFLETYKEDTNALSFEIKKASYWLGYNAKQERIYINTSPNVGKIHYDMFYKKWRGPESIDYDAFEKELLSSFGTDDMALFCKTLKEAKTWTPSG